MRLTATTLLTLTVLTGCSTTEYRQAYGQCELKGYNLYPTRLESVIEDCTREVEVDTGKTECVTTYEVNSERTVCGPILKTVTETYQCEVKRDSNQKPRALFSEQCAAQTCIRSHGNTDCE